MGELFSFGGLILCALLLYLHLRSKNPQNKLDKDGVIHHNYISSLGYEINQDDFLWLSDLFKQYFPEGNCSVEKYTHQPEASGKNILIVCTSIYYMQHYIRNGESESHQLMLNGTSEIMDSVIYIERDLSDTYSMYLIRKCELEIGNEYHVFKGRLIHDVGIEALKREAARWFKHQKEFADRFKSEIEVKKQAIIAKQKKYDSEFYYPSESFQN
jgi:hypothetical protein